MSFNQEVQSNSVSACRFEEDDNGVHSRGVIRIAPKNRWVEEEHFHPDLRLASNVLCCQFQSRARECVALAFSPRAGYAKILYEVCFGGDGNTRTILRRGRNQTIVAPSRVCQENAWTSYWACLVVEEEQGDVPEKNKDGKAADADKEKEDEGREAPETASEDREEPEDSKAIVDEKAEKDRKTYKNTFYVGLGDTPGEDCIGILKDTLVERRVDENGSLFRYAGLCNRAVRDRQAPTPLLIRNVCFNSLSSERIEKLKTLTEIKMIHVDGVDDETKALLAEYEEECKKAQARADKFGVPYKSPPSFLPWSQQRRLRANPKAGFQTGLDLSDPTEKSKQQARRKRFGTALEKLETTTEVETDAESMPVEEAWDKENFVRGQRTDPPPSLWKNPPGNDVNITDSTNAFNSISKPPVMVPEKIHIFSIDWAAFKQIRTNDIMAFFSIYGPSYVEWLGDLSCNVIFQDRFSASRAFENLSQEIPSPPPETLDPSRRVVDERSGKNEDNSPPDLGAMGWRFSKSLLRKISSDRYGQRGTTARLLMRLATSSDILEKRPESWPKPPPGFSTKHVLGPSSDLMQKRGRKAKSKRDREGAILPTNGDDHPLLNASLSATRAGFSVEEVEAERDVKKRKVATDI